MQVLNKYVGQSEENIRNLFAEADEEYKQKVRSPHARDAAQKLGRGCF